MSLDALAFQDLLPFLQEAGADVQFVQSKTGRVISLQDFVDTPVETSAEIEAVETDTVELQVDLQSHALVQSGCIFVTAACLLYWYVHRRGSGVQRGTKSPINQNSSATRESCGNKRNAVTSFEYFRPRKRQRVNNAAYTQPSTNQSTTLTLHNPQSYHNPQSSHNPQRILALHSSRSLIDNSALDTITSYANTINTIMTRHELPTAAFGLGLAIYACNKAHDWLTTSQQQYYSFHHAQKEADRQDAWDRHEQVMSSLQRDVSWLSKLQAARDRVIETAGQALFRCILCIVAWPWVMLLYNKYSLYSTSSWEMIVLDIHHMVSLIVHEPAYYIIYSISHFASVITDMSIRLRAIRGRYKSIHAASIHNMQQCMLCKLHETCWNCRIDVPGCIYTLLPAFYSTQHFYSLISRLALHKVHFDSNRPILYTALACLVHECHDHLLYFLLVSLQADTKE
jgi:hypothetical protein